MNWENAFTQATPAWKNAWEFEGPFKLSTLSEVKHFLDLVHIKYCLLKPLKEFPDYPVVETRELLPSFETDPWEFKNLPGFSMVAFARPINYFNEIFQFDILHPLHHSLRADFAAEQSARNLSVFISRIAKSMHQEVHNTFSGQDITDMSFYPKLMPYINAMDRAHVLGMHGPHPLNMQFHLAGVYASFPSDLDTEVKRYGLHIGKFTLDDPDSYEKNRNFVLQYLMELYGFPFSSERRTSATLFARKLQKNSEPFLIRTLSQSDRTITTMWNNGENTPYPHVEKTALVSVDEDYEQLDMLKENGFMVDAKRRIVILNVGYAQHKFSNENVRQERAMSVIAQNVIHPLTGEMIPAHGIIRDSTNMVLRLNDIARGEHTGRIVYKRSEIVENTDTEEKRLKFLSAWLSKHQRRMIGYSDDFFHNINHVLNGYLYPAESNNKFDEYKELFSEVAERYNYIIQARKIQTLEYLHSRSLRGERISYARMLEEAVELLHSLKFEIVNYFDSLVVTAISIGESMLNDRYLIRTYIEKNDDDLTKSGIEVKKNYGKLVSLVDELTSIRKSRMDTAQRVQTTSP